MIGYGSLTAGIKFAVYSRFIVAHMTQELLSATENLTVPASKEKQLQSADNVDLLWLLLMQEGSVIVCR